MKIILLFIVAIIGMLIGHVVSFGIAKGNIKTASNAVYLSIKAHLSQFIIGLIIGIPEIWVFSHSIAKPYFLYPGIAITFFAYKIAAENFFHKTDTVK